MKDYYSDYMKLLERDDISAVSIATPDFSHTDIAVAAAKAGALPRPLNQAYLFPNCSYLLDKAHEIPSNIDYYLPDNALIINNGLQLITTAYSSFLCTLQSACFLRPQEA